MSAPQHTAAALAASRSLQQGDFLECLVESSMKSIVGQLKVEYQRELSKALEAAGLEKDQPWQAQECSAADDPSMLREAAKVKAVSVASPDEVPDSPKPASEPGGAQVQVPGMVQGYGNGALAHESSPRIPPKRFSIASAPGGRLSAASEKSPLKQWHRASSDNDRIKITMKTKKDHYALTEHEEEMLKRLRARENRDVEAEPNLRFGYAQTKGNSRLMSLSLAGATMSRVWAFNIINKRLFDFTMGMVIVANAITIGMETSITVHGEELPPLLLAFEYVFLAVYIFEISLRFHALGLMKALESRWVRFDASLVLVGIVNLVMVASTSGKSSSSAVVGNINMLKLLRLARLARTVRVLVQFRTLWLLCHGLIQAFAPMAWTCLVMFMVVYVFAVVGMEIIVGTTGDGDVVYADSAAKFDSMWSSMLSLMQVMFLDSSASIYRPLIMGSPWLMLYFGTFVLIGPVALMGIVTAILVESSLRTANEDNEAKKAWESMKRKEMLPVLQQLFATLDTNSDGEVDLEELLESSGEVKEQIQRIIDLTEMEEIFRMLDVDNSGAISMDEFIDGIMRSQVDKPSELIVLVRQSKAILEILRTHFDIDE